VVLEVVCAGVDVCETALYVVDAVAIALEDVFSTSVTLGADAVALTVVDVFAVVEAAGPGAFQAGSKAAPGVAALSVRSRQAILWPKGCAYRTQRDTRT